MYCENCGKKLEDGEICSCQNRTERKKQNGIRINIYMLISFFMFVFGIEMFLYFYLGAENFLEMIPIAFIKGNKECFSYGIIMMIFAGGIFAGVLAIRDKTAKKISIIICVLNMICLLAACGILGKDIYRDCKRKDFVTGQETITEENTEFVQAVLKNVDNLIQQGNIDGAKAVLADAYAVTNNEEIQKKFNELNIQGAAEKTENSAEETLNIVEDTESGSEVQTEDSEIHRYEFVLSDGTWEDAYLACKERGGHIVTFETQKEFSYVSARLLESGQENNIFFIGGRRNLDSQNYYWVDQNNNLTGGILNAPDAWNSGYWLSNEPSFKNTSLGVDEHVLSIFYNTDINQWIWNDVSNDLVNETPSYSGKMGYICEYEN